MHETYNNAVSDQSLRDVYPILEHERELGDVLEPHRDVDLAPLQNKALDEAADVDGDVLRRAISGRTGERIAAR